MTPEDVRDLFEGALRARHDLEHMRFRLEALRSPVLSPGIAQVVQGGKSDPTAVVGSALADGDDELHRMEAVFRERIGEAAELIQGVRQGLGLVYGDVLADHYLGGLSWDVAARLNDVGKTTALRYRDVAFDWIASVGMAHARRGEGGLLSDPRTA